jgi:hypothetical protein
MTRLKRNPILILAFTILLAACGSTASSVTPTATTAAGVKGEFVGDAGQLAGIAFSTNGQQVMAYLCNGDDKSISLAEWFKGPVTTTGIDITNAHGAHLVATVTAGTITGTVTLKDGQSAPFTARRLPNPGSNYGLFRSQETFGGVRYLGGWIFNPQGFASVSPAGTQAFLAGALVPLPVCCVPTDHGIGIINEQTGALIVSPLPDVITSVTVPHLGTFRLTPCRQAQC